MQRILLKFSVQDSVKTAGKSESAGFVAVGIQTAAAPPRVPITMTDRLLQYPTHCVDI